MIDLRPANLSDADDLFAWRNDPVTLACFRSTAAVPREDHDRWMKFNVLHGYPEHIVLIAENYDGKIGVVRFDAEKHDTMTFEASIALAPEQRGKGLSRIILAQACGYMRDYTIDADIRRENYRSRNIFSQCGFDLVGRSDDFVKYRREPQT